MAYGVWPEGAA
jgi:hypothetical protein